jgi:hypothetical protein
VRFDADAIVTGRIAELALADGVAIEHRAIEPLEIKAEAEAPRRRGRPRKVI